MDSRRGITRKSVVEGLRSVLTRVVEIRGEFCPVHSIFCSTVLVVSLVYLVYFDKVLDPEDDIPAKVRERVYML